MLTHAVSNDIQVLMSRFLGARAQTNELFRIVRPEAMYDRPIPERHRIVFYVGHLAAFDWNLLSGAARSTGGHAEFDRLFAFGIDPVEGGLPTDLPEDWPRLREVYSYRDQVQSQLDAILASEAGLASDKTGEHSFAHRLNIAIEHRLMHAETLAYIFHQMSFERKVRLTGGYTLAKNPVVPESVRIPEGKTTLGLRRDSEIFGWDNEFEANTVAVPAFTVDKYKVTNGQFLQFLEAGGYQNRELWNDADWKWRTAAQISHPVFWVRHGGNWYYRSMFEDWALPSDWPVYVSHAEASAYARWVGKLLPTEAQWHRAAYATGEGATAESFAAAPPADQWDPFPVNACPSGNSPFGVAGMIANGWEWTSTKFGPFPGFRPFTCYPGYSEPFFDGKHYVIAGGSVRTASCMLRPSFRNWFQPHYQYVYSGFRCVSA
jgi:gamma-glutamyl hercynylcysteine S-oxide synthase